MREMVEGSGTVANGRSMVCSWAGIRISVFRASIRASFSLLFFASARSFFDFAGELLISVRQSARGNSDSQ